MKILCTADVHIGRRSSRLPIGSDSASHSCAAAWLRVVDAALEERVDAVVVTGDLIDQANRFFEAYGPVSAGVEKLSEAGIETVVVAGNHDFDVLPRVADEIGPGKMRVLGRGGRWERYTIQRPGGRVHLDGWSFTSEQHLGSPLAEYAPELDRAPAIALLHADLDIPRSRYAPITLGQLRGFPDVFFVLGHVHASRRIDEPGAARAIYPGSPQAMDAAEPGAHGVYILDIEGGTVEARFLPLSTVRYEWLDVPIDDVQALENVDSAIVGAIRSRLTAVTGDEPHVRHLRCKVRLVGRTPFHRQLEARLRDRLSDLEVEAGRASASVEALEVSTLPARDLFALAGGGGPPAIIARLLTDLETGTGGREHEPLFVEVRRAVNEVALASPYLPVLEREGPPVVSDDGLREEISRAARLLLDEMLSQKEPQR